MQKPDHPSYQRHRRQVWSQILLPVIAAALVFLTVTYLVARSAFGGTGDVSRWAAISTMWLVLPVMLGGVVLLGVVGAAIFMLGNVPRLILPYSYRAQRFFYRMEYGTKRLAEMVRRPVLMLHNLAAAVKSGINRARERIG